MSERKAVKVGWVGVVELVALIGVGVGAWLWWGLGAGVFLPCAVVVVVGQLPKRVRLPRADDRQEAG